MSNDYNGKKRSELPDSVFGIPQERKYPMPDEKHTRSAIKLFNHVDPKYEEQLAKAIIKNMKKYNIDGSVVGPNNRLRKYLPKDMIKECIEYVMMDYNIMRGAPFIPKRNSRIYGANYFFVTDGASSYSNGNGKYNPAAKEMRDHMDDWERNNGFNPDDDWTNDINNVSNYRLLKESSIKEETRIEDNKLPKHIYHISYINHDGETFEPRTYDNDNVKNGMERKVKRVCFSDSITRALYSIFPNGAYDADFYVHVPNSDCKVYKTTSDDIYDADITHELWIKEPVQMKCIGKIHVNGVSDKTHTIDVDKDKAGYGKKKYHETRWNWVEKYEKDETLYESYISEDDDIIKESSSRKITTVVFDLGDVLIKSNMQEKLRKNPKIPNQQIYPLLEKWFDDDLDLLSKEEYIDTISKRLAPDFSDIIPDIVDAFSDIEVLSYTIPALKDLKERGYNIYYLSNWSRWGVEILREKNKLDFISLFDGGLFSYEVGVKKPDRKIYDAFLKKFKINPKEAIFVDNKKKNIDAAKKFGLRGALFDKLDIGLVYNVLVESSDITTEKFIFGSKVKADMNKIAKEIVKTIKPIVLTSKNKQQASRIGLTLKCEVESLDHNTICILILDGSQDARDSKEARLLLSNIQNDCKSKLIGYVSKITIGDGDEGCLYFYINKQYMRKISESVVTEDVAVVLSLALFAIFYGGIAAAKIHQKIKPYLDERKYVYSISQKKPTVSDAYGYKNPKDAIIGEAKSYGIKNAEKGKLLYTNTNSLKSKAFLYKFNKKKNIVILYEGTYEDLCKKYKVQLAKLDESKLADRSKIYNTTISKLKKEMLQYDIFKKGSFVKDNNEYIQFMNGMSNDVELYHADLHKLVKNPRSDEGIEYANKNIWGILDNIIKNINTTLPDGYKVSSDGGDWDDVSVDLSCSLSLSESSIIEYGTTGGAMVGSNQPDSVYIVNYMQNNAFSGHKEPKFGVCRKGMKNLHIVGGKYNRFHYVSDLDKFKEEASDIHVYRYKGKPKNEFFDIIEEMKDDNDLDLYKLITGREIKDRSEIQFDGDFIEEECFFDTIDAIKACTEAGLLEASTDLHPVPILTETVQGRPYNYYRDLNGVFIQHEITGLRSKSYETLDDIPEAEKDIVKRGYLV